MLNHHKIKMKTSLLFGFLCCISLGYAALTPTTARELVDIFKNEQGECLSETIELNGDLDFAGINDIPLGLISETRDVAFCGTFDGHGYSVKNLVTNGGEFGGLFYHLNHAMVQNLVIDESCRLIGEIVGALAMVATGITMITNVTSRAMIQGKTTGSLVAAVSGQSVAFSQCVLDGTITYTDLGEPQYSDFYAGLVGHAYFDQGILVINGCANKANITVELKEQSAYVGGLIGAVLESNKPSLSFKNCNNNGFFHVSSEKGNVAVGGLLGVLAITNSGYMRVFSFTNNGEMTTSFREKENATVGGVIGSLNSCKHLEVEIEGSTNNGNIFTTTPKGFLSVAGGIIGFVELNEDTNITLKNNINNGGILNVIDEGGMCGAGGILGNVSSGEKQNVEIDGCENNGGIEYHDGGSAGSMGAGWYGGLVGVTMSVKPDAVVIVSVKDSANKGQLKNAQQSMSCGLFCVNKTLGNVKSIVKNSVNKGTLHGEWSYGIGNIGTSANNVVSLGMIDGMTEAALLFGSIEEITNGYGNKNCNSCKDLHHANLTLVEKNNEFFETSEGKERVEKKLNGIAENEGYGKKWTSGLELSEDCVEVTLSGQVSGVWTSGKGSRLGDIDILSGVMDGRHRFEEVGTSRKLGRKTVMERDIEIRVTDKDRVLIELDKRERWCIDHDDVGRKVGQLMKSEETYVVEEKRDESGRIVGLVVYVDEGEKVIGALNSVDKGNGCTLGLICESTQARMYTGDDTNGTSGGVVRVVSLMSVVFCAFFSLFF